MDFIFKDPLILFWFRLTVDMMTQVSNFNSIVMKSELLNYANPILRLEHYVSDRGVSNTGAPQGTVLSPFLFTLYATDFNYCSSWCISKGDEDEYRATVNDFVTCCDQNHLQLNVSKT